MKKIAKFEKVSYDNFLSSLKSDFPNIKDPQSVYDNIILPKRATVGSAGYDFFTPFEITLAPGETIKIPTGIRV